jgi:error-prone DNA polymerase
MTLGRHPLSLIRSTLDRYRYVVSSRLATLESGRHIRIAGLVITKQRPGTASGVTFVTLEDETGCSNLIVWKSIADEQRDVLLNARLMGVQGELQKEGKVIHVIANKLIDHSELLGELTVRSRDFR